MHSVKIPLKLSLVVLPLVLLACQQSDPVSAFGLSADRLFMGATTSDMVVVNGDARMALGTSRREAAALVMNGEESIRFVLVQELNQGTMYDTLWVDAGTMLPIRYRNDFGDLQSIRMTYGKDGHIVSEVKRGGMVTGVDTVVADQYFDMAEFSMLIPALPLSDGYEAEFPVFHYESGVSSATVRVIGSDFVEYRGETRPVWIVEQVLNAVTSRQLVDKEKGIVLRIDATLGADRRFEEVAR